MTTKVTSDAFAGLKNPYTGEPMEVTMTVKPGMVPMFRSPSTYSTDDVFPTREECLSAWDRVNGIGGLKKNRPVVCAYTGKPLSLVQVSDGWKLSGGFNPHLFYLRGKFLHLAAMRNGTSPFPPTASPRVTAVPRTPSISNAVRATAEAKVPTLDDDKMHELETRFNKKGIRLGEGVVSMFTGRKKRGGR